MPTVTADRVIAAGPTGAALLLAGPAAHLWPGLVRVADVHVLARSRRYAARFATFDGAVPAATAVVLLSPARGVRATRAVVRVEFAGDDAAASFRAMADGFLANLAAAAEERADAA